MTVISTDEDVDTLIWTAIQGSTHAQDYLDYIRQASGRPAEYEAAFIATEEYWRPPGDVASSHSKFSQALAILEEQAQGGNPVAMLHVGQCLHEGIGVQKDEVQGKAWLQRGADLGHGECLITLGRYLRKVDWAAARLVLEKAVELGHLMAHLELSEIEPQRTLFHLSQALACTHPHAYAQYGVLIGRKGSIGQPVRKSTQSLSELNHRTQLNFRTEQMAPWIPMRSAG